MSLRFKPSIHLPKLCKRQQQKSATIFGFDLKVLSFSSSTNSQGLGDGRLSSRFLESLLLSEASKGGVSGKDPHTAFSSIDGRLMVNDDDDGDGDDDDNNMKNIYIYISKKNLQLLRVN